MTPLGVEVFGVLLLSVLPAHAVHKQLNVCLSCVVVCC